MCFRTDREGDVIVLHLSLRQSTTVQQMVAWQKVETVCLRIRLPKRPEPSYEEMQIETAQVEEGMIEGGFSGDSSEEVNAERYDLLQLLFFESLLLKILSQWLGRTKTYADAKQLIGRLCPRKLPAHMAVLDPNIAQIRGLLAGKGEIRGGGTVTKG
ncbi:hypothetical protein FA15DRAFT_654100 [Coprinopsis marcescibilis]|uniref:Uncharacterized protein n=1 Tax=Coprinopsis marcescibilis TaxID=230819 RepID=A0A5C3L2E9_COPMA|nr:hypothetical protein FA15DRAFT_654100 [Coprinopsis marcescibilis]